MKQQGLFPPRDWVEWTIWSIVVGIVIAYAAYVHVAVVDARRCAASVCGHGEPMMVGDRCVCVERAKP